MNLPNLWAWAAGLDFGFAALHLAIVWRGPSWYRFFGAGEAMAAMAARGHPWPAVVTGTIAGVLALFGAYALTAGGHFSQLPMPTEVLWGIMGLYMARGVLPLLLAPFSPTLRTPFSLGSSGVCSLVAVVHLSTVWSPGR